MSEVIIFVSFKELKRYGIDYSRMQIWRLIKEKKFPEPVPISSQRVAWVESELAAWQKSKIEQRDSSRTAVRDFAAA